jgi:FkbM family methyltransferase
MLTEEDKTDRFILRNLFEKRKLRDETKAGFFYFENQELMIAEGPETYVVVSGDLAIGFPLFMTGESDFGKFVGAITLLSDTKGRTIDEIWDVGANIGSICIPAVRRKLVRRAVAFEPEKRLFRLLRANAILNQVDDRIECHNVALGEVRKSVDLTIGKGNTGDYRIAGRQFENDAMGEASRQNQEIDVRPMDDFIERFEPDSTLVFMDIQGYEGFALKGAREILWSSPPLVVEFWPYGMKRLESYAALRETVCSGVYSEFADLSAQVPMFRPLTAEALNSLYEQLGEDSNAATDILFV